MKYFKQYAGMPFIQYLNDYRLTRAGEYLKMTEENVTQIALKCGFENLSYFNRLFRRKFGVTPGSTGRSGSCSRGVRRVFAFVVGEGEMCYTKV